MTVATTVSLDELRTIDLFDGLSDDELRPWAEAATAHEVEAGEVLAEQGEPPPGFQLLLEGSAQGLMVENGRMEPLSEHKAPTWMGAIPVLTGTPFGIRLQASTRCRIARIPSDAFIDLVLSQRKVHQRVMKQVRPVMGRIAALENNRERLAALGTMAAGLAHELNNPAAAAKRAAEEMAEALTVLSSTIGYFVDSGVERAEAQELVALQREAVAAAAARTPLDALDAADAEDDLSDALTDAGVAEPWRLAEPLAAAGLDSEWVGRVAELAGPASGAALEWVAATLTARGLAGELADSTERISHLVGAVKSYAYMDRGDVVRVDLHEGLETTLVVLGHKLKHTSIEVKREYDRSLPQLSVHGSELNQVWTNLLDNAIASLGRSGTITIRTLRDGACALVEIHDDGPGVPDDVRDRIFDPFFTTKEVGEGTGLGLDTVRRIVEDRHHGSVGVESRPADTAFKVWLPLN